MLEIQFIDDDTPSGSALPRACTNENRDLLRLSAANMLREGRKNAPYGLEQTAEQEYIGNKIQQYHHPEHSSPITLFSCVSATCLNALRQLKKNHELLHAFPDGEAQLLDRLESDDLVYNGSWYGIGPYPRAAELAIKKMTAPYGLEIKSKVLDANDLGDILQIVKGFAEYPENDISVAVFDRGREHAYSMTGIWVDTDEIPQVRINNSLDFPDLPRGTLHLSLEHFLDLLGQNSYFYIVGPSPELQRKSIGDPNEISFSPDLGVFKSDLAPKYAPQSDAFEEVLYFDNGIPRIGDLHKDSGILITDIYTTPAEVAPRKPLLELQEKSSLWQRTKAWFKGL